MLPANVAVFSVVFDFFFFRGGGWGGVACYCCTYLRLEEGWIILTNVDLSTWIWFKNCEVPRHVSKAVLCHSFSHQKSGWDEVIIWMPFKKSLESGLLWKKSMFSLQALTQILYSTFGPLTILFFIICHTDTWSTKNFFQYEFYAMISYGCPSLRHTKHFIYVKHSVCQIMNVLYSLLLSKRDTFFSLKKRSLLKASGMYLFSYLSLALLKYYPIQQLPIISVLI